MPSASSRATRNPPGPGALVARRIRPSGARARSTGLKIWLAGAIPVPTSPPAPKLWSGLPVESNRATTISGKPPGWSTEEAATIFPSGWTATDRNTEASFGSMLAVPSPPNDWSRSPSARYRKIVAGAPKALTGSLPATTMRPSGWIARSSANVSSWVLKTTLPNLPKLGSRSPGAALASVRRDACEQEGRYEGEPQPTETVFERAARQRPTSGLTCAPRRA